MRLRTEPFADGADEEACAARRIFCFFVLGAVRLSVRLHPSFSLSWAFPAISPPARVGPAQGGQGSTYRDYEMAAKRFLDEILGVYCSPFDQSAASPVVAGPAFLLRTGTGTFGSRG